MDEIQQKSVIKALDFLRFPLIVLVVMIHSRSELGLIVDFREVSFFTNCTLTFISQIIASTAVPMFFCISGYMFFFNTQNHFGKDIYISKLKRRFFSLFIPYVLWNLILLCVYFLGAKVVPGMMNGKTVNFTNFQLFDFFNIFWNGNSGQPLCYQMWFIRDLMLVVACSPIIYNLIKKSGLLIPSILLFLSFFKDFFPETFAYNFGLTALTYFTSGAYLSLRKTNLTFNKKEGYIVTTIYAVICIIATINVDFLQKAHTIILVLGMFVLYFWSFTICQKHHMPRTLTKGAFFVFALHGLVLMIVARLTKSFILCGKLSVITTYFFNSLLTLLICILTFLIIRQWTWSKYLTGGR